jgi:hypothetical protein
MNFEDWWDANFLDLLDFDLDEPGDGVKRCAQRAFDAGLTYREETPPGFVPTLDGWEHRCSWVANGVRCDQGAVIAQFSRPIGMCYEHASKP